MAYDSYYTRTEEGEKIDEVNPKNQREKKELATVGLAGPLALWVGLIVVAVLLQLFAAPIAMNYGHHPNIVTDINDFANYVLYLPGLIVLPVLAALWVGDRVGNLNMPKASVGARGIINAIYCMIIYLIVILILYVVANMQGLAPLGTMSIKQFVEFGVLIPFAVMIVLTPLFSLLTAARRYA